MTPREAGALNSCVVPRSILAAIAVASLLSFVLLAAHVAHGHDFVHGYGYFDARHHGLGYGLFRFERSGFPALRPPSSVSTWARFADLLAAPVIIVVLAVAFAFGFLRRSVPRVAVYAGFAAVTFLVSEYVAKPLVHETYQGVLSFPSGNVTAVCATAVAMWLALYPLLPNPARGVTLALGAGWVLLMSAAVVGAHWHLPLDALGAVLLSVGIIAAGGAVYESWVRRESSDDDAVGPSQRSAEHKVPSTWARQKAAAEP
jgi:hypothetical protein